jgi:hypothetical protein
LEKRAYEDLAKPSKGYPITYFSVVEGGLFEDVMA